MSAENDQSLSLSNLLRPEIRANPYQLYQQIRSTDPVHWDEPSYDNPVQIVWRVATEDLEIGGKQIRRGQVINLLIGAANRDPAQFPDPDRLDFSRLENRHAGFGFGIHFCLGAPLSRLEGEIALNTVLHRLPNLRLEMEALEWQESPTFRGVKALPVAF
jgi:hypothetical protein